MERISKIMAAVAGAIVAFFVLATPALAETAWWRGEYVQGGRATPLEAILTIEGERVTGRMMERNTGLTRRYPKLFSTVLNGRLRLGVITFGKYYDGLGGAFGEIGYSGYYNQGAGIIEGEWRSGPSRGTFVLRKLGAPPPLPTASPNASRILQEVEASKANRTAAAFAESYWRYRPELAPSMLKGGRPGNGQVRMDQAQLRHGISESLALNQPALARHAQSQCRQLTYAQRRALREIAQARYGQLLSRLAERRAAISAAMKTPISAIAADTVPLRFSESCGYAASSGVPAEGRDEIVVGDHLLLSGVFSAMLMDSFIIPTPDRAGADLQALRIDGVDSADAAALSELLFRMRATPLWNNAMWQYRFFLLGEYQSPLHQVEAAVYIAVCPDRSIKCWLTFTYGHAMTSAARVEVLVNDQFDFVLAHEIGHYALRHFSAVGSCEREKPLERDADLFAVALMRPDTGLFREDRQSRLFRPDEADNRVGSGIELFLTQDYPGFEEGGCQYPPFAERVAAAKAFEARAFPAAR